MSKISEHIRKLVIALIEDKVVSIGVDSDRENRWNVQYANESESPADQSSVTRPFIDELVKKLRGKMIRGITRFINIDHVKDIKQEGSGFYVVTKTGDEFAIPRDEYNVLAKRFNKETAERK